MSGRSPPGFLAALRVGAVTMLRRPWLAGSFLAATALQGTLQGLLIWALRVVLEMLSKQGAHSGSVLFKGAVVVLSVWLLRSLSAFAAELLSIRLAHRVEIESMLETLDKLLRLSLRFFERHSQADVVMASYYDLKGVRAVTLELGRMVLYVSQLVGLAVAAWFMSRTLAVIGLVAVPLGVLPAYWFGREITRAASGERDAVASLHQSFYQIATGIRVIKVNRSQERLLARALQIGHELRGHLVRQALQKGLARLLLESVSGLGLILVLIIGGSHVAQGSLSWQALLGLMVAMMAVYSPVVGMLQIYGTIRSVIPSLDRVEAILREPVEVADRPGARPLLDAPQTIELRDVSFAYRTAPVLHSVSATFHRGETIGIVGPSGAGKSTLVALLLRFYDPTDGGIFLDGVDLRDIRQADLMDRSAIVLQDPFLFVDTVANNIRMGRPDASLDEVMEAARAANVHDEIMEMEHGYDTVLGIGRNARGISGGQRQRLAIAAALLKNAPILFLDEATSSLDSVSERRVQAAIERLMRGRTTFLIAHRFSTLREADRILVLDQGRVAGLGTHEELVAACAVYRHLWEGQGAPPVFAATRRRRYAEASDA
jgi:ATP-binding cassette, subfamily B, bacterial MsbA